LHPLLHCYLHRAHLHFSLISSFLSASLLHRPLHSFPTRRSSDLVVHRMFTLIMSTKPPTARAASDRARLWERPNTTMLTPNAARSEEHTSELQSRGHLVCRLLLEKKKNYPKSEVKSNTQERTLKH